MEVSRTCIIAKTARRRMMNIIYIAIWFKKKKVKGVTEMFVDMYVDIYMYIYLILHLSTLAERIYKKLKT